MSEAQAGSVRVLTTIYVSPHAMGRLIWGDGEACAVTHGYPDEMGEMVRVKACGIDRECVARVVAVERREHEEFLTLRWVTGGER